MYWNEFALVALVHLLAVVSPGPDFAVVIRNSVSAGHRAGLYTAIGVGSAIFLHVAADGYAPTEGCVALAEADLVVLLAAAGPGDVLTVKG